MGETMIVIGGGIGGLSTGIYARRAGFEVDIFEKQPVAGGECTGWDRKGCHIDNCIHWLTGTKPGTELYEVWREVGALTDSTTYAPVDCFFSVHSGGQEATLWNDLERTERELLALAPEDEKEIRKFTSYVRMAECCEVPVSKPMEMMRLFDLLRMGMRMKNMPKVMKEYGDVTLDQLASRFKNPLLQKLISSYMPGNYAAYALIVSYATFTSGNGKTPMGGSKAMAQRMVSRFEELGGHLHLGCEISRIIIENGRATGVEFADGTTRSADYVVFAADMHLLYDSLIDPSYIPADWKHAYEDRKQYPMMSGFQTAFMVDSAAAPDKPMLFSCEPVQVGTQTVDALGSRTYVYEPTWAPAGKTVMQIAVSQFDADFEWWRSLSKEEYEKEKARIAEDFAQQAAAAFPALAGNMELLDSWTPLTYVRYCGAYHGSYMGFAPFPGVEQPTCDGRVEGVKGLYVAGQWIMSPGGLPVAAASGKFAVQRIEHDRKKKR